MRTVRPQAAAVVLGGVLLLGACTAAPVEEDTAPDRTAAPDESVEPTEPEESDEPGDTVAGSGDPACLEGEWDADPTALEQSTLSAPGLSDVDAEVEATGTSTVTFADGAMTTAYDDQVLTITMAAGEQEILVEASYDGEVLATYTAEEGVLDVGDVDTAGLTMETSATVGGEPIDIPDLDTMVGEGFDLGGRLAFECSDTELRLVPEVEGGEGFAQVLTRS